MTAAIYNSNILLWEAPSVSFIEIKKVVYKVSKKTPLAFSFLRQFILLLRFIMLHIIFSTFTKIITQRCFEIPLMVVSFPFLFVTLRLLKQLSDS